MSEQQQKFIDEFRKQIIAVFIFNVAIIFITAIGFYFNTNHGIQMLADEQTRQHDRQVILTHKVESIDRVKMEKDDYIREIDEIKTLLRNLDAKIDKLR